MNKISDTLLRVRQLNKIVNRLQSSIRKDEQGISQKDKRVLNVMVNHIYRELVVLTKQQREEI